MITIEQLEEVVVCGVLVSALIALILVLLELK